MFANLGPLEIILILVVVLLLFGAKRLPEIGSSFGKSIREFKRGLTDVERSVRDADTHPTDRLSQGSATTTAPQQEEALPEPKRLLG